MTDKKIKTITVEELLSNDRYNFNLTFVHQYLEGLYEKGEINIDQLEQVIKEDTLLKIKYRTFKRCLIQINISVFLVIIGLLGYLPFGYLLIVGCSIIGISSLFGITSNWLNKTQIRYLKN